MVKKKTIAPRSKKNTALIGLLSWAYYEGFRSAVHTLENSMVDSEGLVKALEAAAKKAELWEDNTTTSVDNS
jgi:hypothetical protein